MVGFYWVYCKKDQISGISSPKLTLYRIGNTANLVYLPDTRWTCSIIDRPQGTLINYCKVTSSNTSHLEAQAGFFRLLMKGIFDPYVL